MAVPHSRIAELASVIAQETKALDELYSSSGLSPPTFAAEGYQKIGLPNDINSKHYRIVEATSELQALLLGPFGLIKNYVYDQTTLIPILAIYRFKIGHNVPDDGQISYDELSRKCGLEVTALRRILRYAMTKYIFHEPEKGYVAHTAPSKVLIKMPFIDDWMGMTCEEMWPSATKTIEALIKWPASEEPNHSGYAIAHNTSGRLFESISKDAPRVKRFANAMKLI